MKKTHLLLGIFLLAISTVSCGSIISSKEQTQSNTQSVNDNEDIRQIYNLYIASGGTLTYEQWLASIKGEKGDKGDKGDPGQNGKDGTNGKDGNNGKDGTNGKDGADGFSLLTGNGAPSASLGKNGDSYIDLDTWNYYIKNDNVWTLKGNLKGESVEQQFPKYTVSFNTFEGTAISPQIIERGGHIEKPVDPIKSGYTFVNWALDGKDLSDDFFLYYTVDRDIEINAVYHINQYALHISLNNDYAGYFVMNDDSVIRHSFDEEINYGQHIKVEAFEENGSSFLNWSIGETIVSENEIYDFYLSNNSVEFVALLLTQTALNYANNMSKWVPMLFIWVQPQPFQA